MGMIIDWKCRFKRADDGRISPEIVEEISIEIERKLVIQYRLALEDSFLTYDISGDESEYECAQFMTESIHAEDDITEALDEISRKYPEMKFRMIGFDYCDFFAIDFMNGEHETLKSEPIEFEEGKTVKY